jgi:hypothetical protein
VTRWIVGVIVVAVVAIGVIVVVASGSDSEPEPAAGFGPDAAVMAEFRDCMSEHGAELPEPPSGGPVPAPSGGVPPSFDQGGGAPPAGVTPEANEETTKALEACSDLAPEGFGVVVP